MEPKSEDDLILQYNTADSCNLIAYSSQSSEAHIHNRKLDISTARTKAKSWEPACSQALIQNKIGSRSDPNRRLIVVDGVWSGDG